MSLDSEDHPEESDGDSPDEQRMELTPPSEDEQSEGSSSTSASTGEVAAAQSSERTHICENKIEGQAPP